ATTARHGFEIDMRGQILLAGMIENRRIAMAADRLQRVAGGAAVMPVIDDQRDAALGGDADRDGELSTISPSRSNVRWPPMLSTCRSMPPTCWRTGSASRNSFATRSSGLA